MNKIKFFRVKKTITVKKLSEISGVAVGYISELENNHKSNPSKEIMERISTALGQTVIDVFFPEEIKKEVS